MNSPDKDVGVVVQDEDVITPEQRSDKSSVGYLDLRQFQVPGTETGFIENGSVHRLIGKIQLHGHS